MKRKPNFCSIFAIVTVAMTAFLITGCEKNEEYYSQSNEYTLADRMMTRAAEGGDVTPPILIEIEEGGDTSFYDIANGVTLEVFIHWDRGNLAFINPTISTQFKDGISYNDHYEFSLSSSHVWWIGSSSVGGNIRYRKRSKISGSWAYIDGEFEKQVNLVYVQDGDSIN